jgi:hypothetical protein
MQHPFRAEMKCDEATAYQAQVYERQKGEAQMLATLTGWKLEDIEKKMELAAPTPKKKWYQNLWGK